MSFYSATSLQYDHAPIINSHIVLKPVQQILALLPNAGRQEI